MLWYKAWLETRSRFIFALVGCTALCSTWIVEFSKLTKPLEKSAGGFLSASYNPRVLAAVWILSIILLMMGGSIARASIRIVVLYPYPTREPVSLNASADSYGVSSSIFADGSSMVL